MYAYVVRVAFLAISANDLLISDLRSAICFLYEQILCAVQYFSVFVYVHNMYYCTVFMSNYIKYKIKQNIMRLITTRTRIQRFSGFERFYFY